MPRLRNTALVVFWKVLIFLPSISSLSLVLGKQKERSLGCSCPKFRTKELIKFCASSDTQRRSYTAMQFWKWKFYFELTRPRAELGQTIPHRNSKTLLYCSRVHQCNISLKPLFTFLPVPSYTKSKY